MDTAASVSPICDFRTPGTASNFPIIRARSVNANTRASPVAHSRPRHSNRPNRPGTIGHPSGSATIRVNPPKAGTMYPRNVAISSRCSLV